MERRLETIASLGPVIPVLVIEELAHAVPLAKALVAGGVRVLEVTLRTPAALECIRAIAAEIPEAMVGAGTLRTPADAEAVLAAGARFAVSPGYSSRLAQACRDLDLPLLPGVATSSEIMQATEEGSRFLKFFPAIPAGGAAMLKSWASVFADVRFCPTGGIGLATAPDLLALPNVVCVGGSWLTPAAAIREGRWDQITTLAREAAALRR
ncbi:MAG: bifunctional 4-hydroxy-2-oxoglutarate aldolase/2-dehydro-3-deoxy-phosphogluconate aldolase [Pseudomonadota bacterium]|nr:bifunctional 4-hydroxy-2-oxoglutarate aldolase/2-dehydro-3-deoxy-phosphogluconate aldolase [Pseudomonadota bacterium]